MIQNRKSALRDAARPVIEAMEDRRLLSAALTLSSSLLVFNAVQGTSSQVETLTLTNSGDATVNLAGFSVVNDPSSSSADASQFTVINAGSAPASLAPGQTFGLQLQYNANAVVTNTALLDVNSDSPASPTEVVALHGIGTRGLGGTNQPSLATVLRAYNIPTIVGLGPNDANASTDTLYPEPPDPSSQEVVLQRLVKAGSGPVTIQALASFTASAGRPYTLGTYDPSNITARNDLFFTPASESQSTYIQPQGATSFDPGSKQFGFYFASNVQVKGRIGYSEDVLNSWDKTDPRKMRFFPLENSDGTVVPNAYILTSTEWSDPTGYDFTNMVAIVRNVKAANGAPTNPSISLQDPNALLGSSNMIFSRIESPNTAIGDIEHDRGVLQVHNAGNQPLIISSYAISSAWTLVSPPAFPVTIAGQATLDLNVLFKAGARGSVPYNETNSPMYPGGGGAYAGTLTLNSNDPVNPVATQNLTGWWQLHSENSNEPSLQTQINLLAGYTTNINPTPISQLTEDSTAGSPPKYYGEEVVAAYWQAAFAGDPVIVDQISAYHTEGNTTVTYYTNATGGGSTRLMTTSNDSGQTMIPILQSGNNSSNPAMSSFTTSGVFGWRVDAEYSQDSKNVGAGAGHHFRFYPLRDASGTLLPNAYIMCMDYTNEPENYDFQDNVYIVSNIRPVTVVSGISAPQTTGAPAAPSDFHAMNATGGNFLQWAASPASTLSGYNLYRATSSAGPYTLISSGPLPAGSVTFTDTTAPKTGTSYYEITAVTSSGESLGAMTSVINSATGGGGGSGGGAGSPVASAETRNTLAGTAVVINEAPDATDNGLGTVVASSVLVTTSPGHGTTVIDPSTGAITYTPAAGFTGTDTFQYTISDSTGAVSPAATITINVSATQLGNPVAANLTLTAPADSSLVIDVVASATDDTSTLNPSSVTITQQPTHGSATVDPTTGKIIYAAAPGYVGPDLILYTIGDTLLAVSGAASINLSVKLAGPESADSSATTLFATPVTVDVIAAATDLSGIIAPASVTVTTQPSHGSVTINPTSGALTYTPTGNFVGADSLQYTISDSNHTISNPITLSLNVGVGVNNTGSKSLSFVDGSGDIVIITLGGNGTAAVFFTGSGSANPVNGKVTISGAGLGIGTISATGTTIASSLTITRRGASAISIGSINVAGPINKISASTATLTGALTVSGALGSLQLGAINGATITIGSISAPRGGFQLTAGNVTDTTLTSAIPIKGIKATSWTTTGSPDSITAPSIASIVTTGAFDANITTTGGTPFSLGTVHIGGALAGETWNIAGKVNSVYAGSVASGWTGNFSQSLNTLTVHGGGFAGTLDAASINTVSITGDDTGDITTGSIKSMKVVGQMNGSSVTLTTPLSGKVQDLGRLSVSGATTNSSIRSAGNIGSITSAGFNGSSIDAGVGSGVTLPASLNDITSSASIASVAVTGRGTTFANSDIGAQTIGALNLGNIISANGGIAFGIAGGTIKSLAAKLDSTGVLALNAATLLSASSVNAYLTAHALTLNSFVIVPGV